MKRFLFKLAFLGTVLAALALPTFADTASGTCGGAFPGAWRAAPW